MAKHPFLSPEWMDEVRKIRDEYKDQVAPISQAVRMNQVVTESPFEGGDIKTYVDTTGGRLDMESGHLENPDLTVTLDYDTAKAIFVEGNPQAAMQAFMAGKVRVDGDMSKLMALQATPPDPKAEEIASRINEITSD